MAIIQKIGKTGDEDMEELEPLCITGVECQMVYWIWNTIWQFFERLSVELLYDPVITFLDVYPIEMKTYFHTKIYIPVFIAALFMIVKT